MTLKIRRAAVLAAVAVLALSACVTSSPSGGPETSQTASPHGETPEERVDVKRVEVQELTGEGERQQVSILCVDGIAFLYVWEKRNHGGGPSIARFPEQDDTCTPADKDPDVGAETGAADD